MIEIEGGAPVLAVAPGSLDSVMVEDWSRRLAETARTGLDGPGTVDLLRSLEVLKCTAEGLQAVASVELDQAVRAEEGRRGVPTARQGRGVAGQVALARRESPERGRRHLGLAHVLGAEMPHTLASFRAGRITEWRATLLARETACLSREHRMTVDAELAADPARVEGLGDGELVAAAKRLAYKLDPDAVVARRRKAESERRVSLRPAPDVMTHLSALLPVKDGVAVYAALDQQATALVARGDGRGRGQIMADTLVQRVLGTGAGESGATGASNPAEDTDPGARPGAADVSVMIHLVVSDAVLLGGAVDAAHVDGYGPVPADLARQLAGESTAWLRRLYTRPETGHLIAADARARRFPAGLARLIRLRDQRCRTPWCDAPIRHIDHVTAVLDGGPTTVDNAQGLCEACNYAKQAPGWTARPRPGPRHTVQATTPTGHRYSSTAPVLGNDPPRGSPSAVVPDRAA